MKRFLTALLTFLLIFVPAAPAALADVVEASTSLTDASDGQLNNIELAVEALNGAYVESGDTFSFNDTVGPRTAARGYVSAVNGRGVNVMGGGVSQVAATLYLALKDLGGVDYVDKHTYGGNFTGSYVDSGSDAIVTDYSAGTDFSFVNDGDGLSISIWTTDEDIVCSLATGGDSGDDWGDGDGSSAGYAEFYLDGSDALISNVELAADAIFGLTLEPGDTFSFNDTVGARTAARGYRSAVNGRGVNVVGGGVAQVASVIWLAVKDMDDVTILERSTYGDRYNQSYVDDPDDAILTDYAAGVDFRFRYDGDFEMMISPRVHDDTLSCEIIEN